MVAAFQKASEVLTCRALGVTMNSNMYYQFMKQFSYKVARYGLATAPTNSKTDAVTLSR
jgi:hypothetical protein